ncbi:hypothetical protein PFBG_03343 [Plasmodium falciparum 7G8]|uniref:Uncharacterized protein n=3 Tax=Plasmodium falciparum TaxID=5833 RepID=A0A024UZW3_PLAFA|nr:hypothetical protein PFFVO_05819 [Plasmodium falciparum Vietnam Oak-Knoll (FVO)]ETW41935.1 hypothetical protein PFNF135_03433 [Plasmodium falciparum NF135/5.C10]EUR70114.1 hypothetical protein PFBG_03343 [Plasmodium falciparum 7G8]
MIKELYLTIIFSFTLFALQKEQKILLHMKYIYILYYYNNMYIFYFNLLFMNQYKYVFVFL